MTLDNALLILLGTALSLGAFHTLVGPDHYLPFIVLGRAEGWPLRKALFWTGVCGVGHVLSSVVLGVVGMAAGVAVGELEAVEGTRGELAGIALLGFGALYFGWGLWRGLRGRAHTHVHVHADGSTHKHVHAHDDSPEAPAEHSRADHNDNEHVTAHQRTLWSLFIIFVLGPCEPLIPLVMFPASRHSALGVGLVSLAYGAATLAVMLALVTAGYASTSMVRLRFMERYAHAMAGLAIFASGAAIRFLGL